MPNSLCDLHLHTHYSDGRASPAEILRHAASLGLKTVAITDHDNLNAWAEASHVAESLGLELVPGIELTTHWATCPRPGIPDQGQDIDLLGYFFDPHDPDLLALAAHGMEDLRRRMADCCSRLTAAGFPVSIFDLLDENPRYPGAGQLISALWHRGHAGSWSEGFHLFMRFWPGVPPARLPVQEAIAAVHQAGGVAILAHPVAVRCEPGLLPAEKLAELVAYGLDGLEVLHPRLDAEARLHFSSLARQAGLLVSGGSDEHGWENSFSRLGSELVTYEIVHQLRRRAEAYQDQARHGE